MRLRQHSIPDIVRAIEENAAELLLKMGRLGGGEQRIDRKLSWTIGGSPIDYHNCVVRADLDADEADHAIAESIRLMTARGVPGTWHVGPSMRPSDLGRRLLAAGFSDGGTKWGMAADLSRVADESPSVDGLPINRISAPVELETWADTLAQGFGEGEREARWAAKVYARAGFDRFRHYLGSIGEQPVGTATLFLGAGVAGIYFVMTVPAFRRRGIGAALTLAALREARDLGFRVGVLCSSPAGHSVYSRIGFADYCEMRLYEWS
ncbi:MAG TPA: GNAT family N-acetyltransferase [Actinopolymorphaceae bacterium]|jgi:GNAT superfamily N-acetyltransferase